MKKEISIIIRTWGKTKEQIKRTMDSLDDPLSKSFEIIKIHKKGHGKALNEGIRKATCNYVTFLDAGDTIVYSVLPELLFSAKALKNFYSNYLAFNHFVHYDVENYNSLFERSWLKKRILGGVVFSKSFLIDIGMFNENFFAPEEIIFERYKYAFLYVNRAVIHYIRDKNSMTLKRRSEV